MHSPWLLTRQVQASIVKNLRLQQRLRNSPPSHFVLSRALHEYHLFLFWTYRISGGLYYLLELDLSIISQWLTIDSGQHQCHLTTAIDPSKERFALVWHFRTTIWPLPSVPAFFCRSAMSSLRDDSALLIGLRFEASLRWLALCHDAILLVDWPSHYDTKFDVRIAPWRYKRDEDLDVPMKQDCDYNICFFRLRYAQNVQGQTNTPHPCH